MKTYRNQTLASWTTMGIGGVAAELLMPQNKDEFVDIVGGLLAANRKHYVLGNGSNILISDGFIKSPVVCTREIESAIEIDPEGAVRCAASADLRTLINQACRQGLRAPVELLTIPASLGGALVMNAGRTTMGVTIGQFVEQVTAFDGKNCYTMTAAECDFGHRYSVFQRLPGHIILDVQLRFQKASAAEINEARRESLKAGATKCYRTSKSAGSVFSTYDSSILTRLMGLRLGDAQYAPATANCILNLGGARFSQVMWLVRWAQLLHILGRKPCRLEWQIWR